MTDARAFALGERHARLGAAYVLYDAALPERTAVRLFDGSREHGEARSLSEKTGRGPVRLLDRGDEKWVLRHYHRGGLLSRFVRDHYVWLGLDRSRSFREWRLLARLTELGLPAPRPVAARVLRSGLLYQADIATVYLPGTRPLSALLRDGSPSNAQWTQIGRMVRAFHDHGIQHPDLNAHNILLDRDERAFLVDFDNARIREPGAWRETGLARLERSLRKVALETGTPFAEEGWRLLVAGYRFP